MTKAGLARAERNGQRATDRLDLAAQRELAAQRVAGGGLDWHLLGRGQQPERDGEVEARAGLADVRGREVHRDALLRKLERRVENGRAHALARLANGAVRQSDERERAEPSADVHLNRHLLGGDPFESESGHTGEHAGDATRPAVTRGHAKVTIVPQPALV